MNPTNPLYDKTNGTLEATISGNASKWEALGALLPGHNDADGAAGAHEKVFRSEAAYKLIVNHEAVLRDVCNFSTTNNIIQNPLTQKELRRVNVEWAPHADAAMREVARRLLGRAPGAEALEERQTGDTAQAAAWTQTCLYLACRLQAHKDEKPGRTPEMASGAVFAMRAVLNEVGQPL